MFPAIFGEPEEAQETNGFLCYKVATEAVGSMKEITVLRFSEVGGRVWLGSVLGMQKLYMQKLYMLQKLLNSAILGCSQVSHGIRLKYSPVLPFVFNFTINAICAIL